MRRLLFSILVLSAVAWMPVGSDDPQQGTHTVEGPVEVLWETQLDTNHYCEGPPMVVGPDGARVVVSVPVRRDLYFVDVATVAFDAGTGEEIWTAIPSLEGGLPEVGTLAISSDGATVFSFPWAYETFDYPPYARCHTAGAAYGAVTGEEIWTWPRECSPYGCPGLCLEWIATKGSILVVGGRIADGAYFLPEIRALDAATGQSLWVLWDVWALDGTLSPDGSTVFVTQPNLTRALDATTGEVLWMTWSGGHLLTLSQDGLTVFVTREWADLDYVTHAYNAITGEEIWYARYDGAASGDDRPHSLEVTPDGSRVFVTGESQGIGSGKDYATVAYDAATGEELWTARYDGPGSGDDRAYSVAASPDSATVFVAGSSMGIETASDYATVAYDATTGEEMWIARFDGPASGEDGAGLLEVSPDGATVFVSGFSSGVPRLAVTIAYSPGLPVTIDVKPGSDSNPINPRSIGVIPVAILGSDTFDVTNIDVTTLAFGPDAALTAHNLTDTFTYNDHLQDANLDGYLDLVTHYRVRSTGIACGDDSATLTGELLDGRSIEGTDSIVTPGCRSFGRAAAWLGHEDQVNPPRSGRIVDVEAD